MVGWLLQKRLTLPSLVYFIKILQDNSPALTFSLMFDGCLKAFLAISWLQGSRKLQFLDALYVVGLLFVLLILNGNDAAPSRFHTSGGAENFAHCRDVISTSVSHTQIGHYSRSIMHVYTQVRIWWMSEDKNSWIWWLMSSINQKKR